MNSDWILFLDDIAKEIERLEQSGASLILFRGHNDNRWTLNPSLFRKPWIHILDLPHEQNLHSDFELYSGPLYDKKLNSWEQLVEMRHSQIPTRLLDWTENFASALFFALEGINWYKQPTKEQLTPCIWILDPYSLNEKFYGCESVFSFDELGFNYTDLFDESSPNKDQILKIKGPIAVSPPRVGQRCFAQKSIFTLHIGDKRPIEGLCGTCVKKFDIPLNVITYAYDFLKMAGINDYSLFPDTDGLGRFLVKRFQR